ncbi:MAG TPA: tRNA (adenosine(37)-N6)-threonylcarbamoyltransferase complex ATPase subunit type 1 TsaE [Candidatus Polarisedimenticolaceae bacterium]
MDTRQQRRDKPGGPAPRPPAGRRTLYALSEEETSELGRAMGRGLRGGELVVLEGDLGVGKTTFTRGLAEGVGIDPGEVSSPSFTLVQEYKGGRVPFFHVDLYRLVDGDDDVSSLGLEDLMASGGVVVVEWGDKLPSFLRHGALGVRFQDLGEGSRRIEISPDARAAAAPSRGDA